MNGHFVKRRCTAAIGLLLVGLLAVAPSSHGAPPTEYQVKALFLFNFAQFVEWPASVFPDANTPVTIGVLGDDPFGPALESVLQGETVKSRPLVVKRSRKLEELQDCHVLFICKSENDRLDKILSALDRSSVLTVSEVDGFAKRGGVINFVLQGGKVRFEINAQAAKRKELKLGAKLLQLGLPVGS